jgi:hypothetical protein
VDKIERMMQVLKAKAAHMLAVMRKKKMMMTWLVPLQQHKHA